MGIYDYISPSSPFDADVEKATNENNTAEEWGLIMEICDKVGTSETNAKDCLRSVIKRLHNQDPHVVLQAITLLDACVNNCGKTFQLEVASRDFETELKKILKRWNGTSTKVGSKIRILVKKWSEADFKADPQLSLMTSFYSRLKQEGIDFSTQPEPSVNSKTQRSADPDSVSSQQEVEDIAKAIELSLKENCSPKMSVPQESHTVSLYPSVSGSGTSSSSQTQEARKVRALYDFEAAEDNELTFFAGEIIHVLDDSDANWWKGRNQRGEGLFPANFVTSDLSTEPEKMMKSEKKGVQFNESVEVKTVKAYKKVEIDESKIDRVLHLLHEADPNSDSSGDPEELESLEDEVTEMGPLIDAELERVDRNHAQLTQTCAGLVEALNLYHALMRDMPPKPGPLPPQVAFLPQPPPHPIYHQPAPMPHQEFMYQPHPQPHFNGPFPPPPPGSHYPPAPPNN
ncbi:signal transducing adaptor molecule isoform X1 [Rhodnius prolixus]